MIAQPPMLRPVRRRRPAFTAVRITAVILVGLLTLMTVGLTSHGLRGAWLLGYLLLVVVTCVALRSTRDEAGSVLGLTAVRRTVAVLIALTCVALVMTPATVMVSRGLPLFVFLVVLNVALGRGTQRIASAPDAGVDERQEAVRNRAHRVAYVLFAVVVGGTTVLADTISTQTRSWLGSTIGGGGFIAFLELLFVLPAMVLAFLEAGYDRGDLPELRAGRSRSGRSRLAMALLTLSLALPLVLSLAVALLPVRSSATAYAPTAVAAQLASPGGPATPAQTCREFLADQEVGAGVEADLRLHAEVCWDGRRATESFGMNASDCIPSSTVMAAVTTSRCTRTTNARGTLSFTYRVDVAPALIPFLHRQATVRLVIDRNGTVEQYP